MNSHLKLTALTFALVVSYPVVAADLSQLQIRETGQRDSSTTTNNLSETDLARARVWYLSETEWQRYQQLMQGIRGSISPSTISPIEVLGIHARDEAERQQYAEAWARAMREDMDRLQEERAARGDPTYEIGMGIHTGPVVLGNVGSSVKMDYTVIGDVVNTTSRLCNMAKGGQILISHATWEEVRHKVEARELEPMQAKGKSEPLRLYEVVGLK